jgi:ubiquinone/menaquinone biosynthesis C-methylase UbiE
MEKYKNLILLKEKNEKKIINNKKTYYRYMDNIYIPDKPLNLNFEDVIALSEIRLKNQSLINYSYTEEVLNFLISKLKNKNRIIDFGCGGGVISNLIEEKKDIQEILGLDGSDFAVSSTNNKLKNNKKVTANIFKENDKINKEDCYFDGIVSNFVMHFNIYENQLLELHRVLKKNGLFVFNDYIYEENEKHSLEMEKRLKKLGFELEILIVGFNFENKIKNHKIVIAKKIN